MASESSFDIVSKVDKQEVSNALHQALMLRAQQRYLAIIHELQINVKICAFKQ